MAEGPTVTSFYALGSLSPPAPAMLLSGLAATTKHTQSLGSARKRLRQESRTSPLDLALEVSNEKLCFLYLGETAQLCIDSLTILLCDLALGVGR